VDVRRVWVTTVWDPVAVAEPDAPPFKTTVDDEPPVRVDTSWTRKP
jgi:hypothetical protein